MKRNTEMWKTIQGFPDYEISNMGRLRSLDRVTRCSDATIRLYKGKIKKLQKNRKGYYNIGLYIDRKCRKKLINVLVITHFGPPKPSPNHECNHIDGDKENNWWTNLEWLTRDENIQHAIDTGLHNNTGEKNGRSKLTEKEVIQIRELNKTGKYKQYELDDIFAVSTATINGIINKRYWRDI